MSSGMSTPSVRKKSFARSSKPSVRMCIREHRNVIVWACLREILPVAVKCESCAVPVEWHCHIWTQEVMMHSRSHR
ncbi:hypothetical protein PAMP_013620 [Pampus punctatissimus]